MKTRNRPQLKQNRGFVLFQNKKASETTAEPSHSNMEAIGQQQNASAQGPEGVRQRQNATAQGPGGVRQRQNATAQGPGGVRQRQSASGQKHRTMQQNSAGRHPKPGSNPLKPGDMLDNAKTTKGSQKRDLKKAGFSMGKRISVSYIQMAIDAFLSCLILILLVFIAYHSVIIGLDVKNITDELAISENLNQAISEVAIQKDIEIALSDMSGEKLLNTFGTWQKPHERLPIWFYRRGNTIWIMVQTWLGRPEGAYVINIFKDITSVLFEMVVLLSVTVFLGAAVLLTIFFRGHSITKNVLYPIAEMTKMTKEIKAQNLNLRLNVSNAKDELKELVITFNEMMDRIENAYNKQNQFVSDASHELRTPISVVQGYARMLERWGKEDPEVLQESIEAISNEADNMKELVEKLLFIARNDKDTLVLSRERFSLSEMMDELVKETRMVDEKHTIEASVEQGIDIIADRNRIKQAMRIFIDNAQKYTEPGKQIEIHLKQEGKQAVLSVKDSGCGISVEDLQNVFDRFFRADESRDRNKGGHGLGLSIAKIIVLRHGGKINVKSKMDEGSIFSILFDIAQTTE